MNGFGMTTQSIGGTSGLHSHLRPSRSTQMQSNQVVYQGGQIMSGPTPVLEPAAKAFADSTAKPPFLSDLGPIEGRKTVDSVQDGDIPAPAVDTEELMISGGPDGKVSIKILRPAGSTGPLPVLLFTHG